jgi:hypothetical protein
MKEYEKTLQVYDIEVFKNVFLWGAVDIKTEEIKIFEISKWVNNSSSLYKHLTKKTKGLIGFNNISYDNPLTNFFLATRTTNNLRYYELSKKLIENNNTSSIEFIPQLDIYKINHWDNKGVSLKKCGARLNFPVIADLPYKYDAELSLHQVKRLREYLVNDLQITLKLYKLYDEKYYLRNVIHKEYGLLCHNWSDSKIGEELVLKLYCDITGNNPDHIRSLRTPRNSIKVKDILFDYIKFKDPLLKEQFNNIKKEVISNTKGGFKYVFNYGGIETHLAQGGIHACAPGIYKSNDTHFIIDIDIESMYPSVMISNQLHPKHLGKIFCDVLKDSIVGPRNKIHKIKSKDKSLHYTQRRRHVAFSDGLKLAGRQNYY